MKTIYYLTVAFTAASLLFVACNSEDDTPVPEPLEAVFSVSDTVVVQGSEVTFVNQSTGVDSTTSYRWTFEGGTPASSTSSAPPAITYETVGRYQATLRLTSGAQESSATRYVNVQIDSAAFCAENPFETGCVTSVVVDKRLQDNITQAGEVNVYEVVVDSSGVLEVTLNDIPGDLNLGLEVQTKDKKSVGPFARESDAGIIYYEQLVRPGIYYVVVRDQGRAVSQDSYTVEIQLDQTDKNEWNGAGTSGIATPLAFNTAILGTLRTADDEDYFELKADRTGILNVRLTGIPEVRTGIFLLDDKGEELDGEREFSFASEAGSPKQLLYLVSESKTYFIKVTGDVSSRDEYTLSVTIDERDVNEPNDTRNGAKLIALDEDVRGTLRTKNDEDWFEIAVEKPGTLIANATTIDDSTNLVMYLYQNDEPRPDEDSQEDSGFDRTTGAPRSLIHLVDSGIYFIQVYNNRNNKDLGGYDLYTLNVKLNTNDPYESNNDRNNADTTVALNEDIRGTIGTFDDKDWFKVTLRPGTVRLTVTEVDANVDMQIYLYAETSASPLSPVGMFGDGNRIERGQPIDLNYNIAEGGTYYLKLEPRVESNDSNLSQMPYTLRIEQSN